jgi:holo-[acyl-carrier protein] synthase
LAELPFQAVPAEPSVPVPDQPPDSSERSATAGGLAVCVGTDVQSIAEVRAALVRFGERYTRRLYTDHEVECCGGSGEIAAPGLAARFAAKEAMIKLLEPLDDLARWKSIEVRRRPGGKCVIYLNEEAQALADRLGLRQVALSMTHGAGVAVATVVGLCQNRGSL